MTLAHRIPAHLLVAASAWTGRLAAAVMGLYTIRLLTTVLGTENYAIFAMLVGLQGWYLLGDLGLGSSLQNFISERRAHQESYSSLVRMTGLLALLLVAVGVLLILVVAQFAAPIVLSGFSTQSAPDKVRNFFVSGVLCLIFGIGGISYKIWYAEQRGYLANLMPALAAAISLGWVATIADSGSPDKLFWCLVAMLLPQAVLPMTTFLTQVGRCSRFSSEGNEKLWPLLQRGLKFWGFAVMSAGVLQIDYIIMSQFLPAHDIVGYNLSNKIFSLALFVYSAVLMALWPVCSEAISKSEWLQVKRHLKKSILMGAGIIAVTTVCLIMFMPEIVKLLSPREHVTVTVNFILLLGFYQLLRVWSDTYAMLLQSMSYLRPFWLYVPFQAVLSFFLQWYLVKEFGVYGVVLGLIGSFIATACWVLPLSFHRRMKQDLSRALVEDV